MKKELVCEFHIIPLITNKFNNMKKSLLFFTILIFTNILYSQVQLDIYAPALKAPANNAVEQIPNVLLDWDAVTGGMNYKVQLDTSNIFSNPTVLATNNTAIQTQDLLFGAMYYWRVKAYTINDSSAWSVVRAFTVTDSVKLFSPVSGVIDQMPDLLLRWTSLSGVKSYHCQLDTINTFTGTPFYYTVNAPKNQVNTSQLLFGTKYYWRVRAVHNTDTSHWSLFRDFTTIDTFKLTTPTNNIVALQMPDVLLKWNLLSGVKGYEVVADTNILFNSPSLVYMKADTNFINADTLAFGLKYYWTVRAFHNNDSSVWTAPFAFNTIDKLSLIAPANNTDNLLYRPDFSWQEITGITEYEFQIDTALNFDSSIADTVFISATTGAAYSPLNDLNPQTKYYWKVRAISLSDTSLWSNTFNFSTGTVGIDENNSKVNDINVFPNPTTGKVNINLDASNQSDIDVLVTDIVGKEVFKDKFNSVSGNNIYSINLSHLPEGLYLIKIISNNNSFTRRIILDK